MSDVRPLTTPDPISPEGLRRGAVVVGLVAGGVMAILAVLWALTTRGYFWPVWAGLPLGLVAAVVAWIAWVFGNTAERTWVSVGVTVTGGLYGTVVAFLTGIWVAAVAAGGTSYFWPVWPALGLATLWGVHVLVSRYIVPQASLQGRVATLASTRSAAIDAQEAELRRIERDLHDGAQAHLVSLGMTIGLAEQRLTGDPDGARELLAEARGGAQAALAELRDLARGIRPPVLQDRGLAAAVNELAVRSPLAVDVETELDRLPPAVESAAYFVVAEALANATKHAEPTHVQIHLGNHAGVLVAEVTDDGVGSANPNGAGLTGLRQRVEALDGTLQVTSPPGGPTSVRAEIPCGA
ncbi:MAG TPA: sensor histidine kinase [Ilumatobacter sp.]|nr:sensor histidine kinase [Ilumatobacter sp.]